MIVTRAASESSLNVDLTKQIRSQPVVLIISGVVILFMVFIPGFPLPQVITLSSLLIFLGISLLRARVSAAAETDKDKEEEPVSEEEYYRNIDNIYELIQIDPIAMEVGYSLIPLVDVDGGNFIDRVVMFRRQFAQDMGMVVPSVRLRDNGYLNPNEYVIKIKGRRGQGKY